MKQFIFPVLSCFLIVSSCSTDKKKTITLSNTSDIKLTDKAIRITRSEVAEAKDDVYPLITNEKGDTIASQLDDLDGDAKWDELFFVINLNPKEKTSLTLNWTNSKPVYTTRTSIRFGKREGKDQPVQPKTSDTITADKIHARLGYQPYQTDGPSWENDKVGFRHYFDGRNSKDLFGKTVSYMSPDSVGISATGGVEDNYHVMADWGRDILAVGNSVGLGGINLMVGDTVSRIGCAAGDTVTNVASSVFTIVSEGDVRSVFTIQHNDWKPFDRTYQIRETTSIWPGMYAFQNTVEASGLQGDETLLVGLVNSNTTNPLKEMRVNDQYTVLFTHDQQTYDKTWWLGMGIILPNDVYQGYGEAPKEGKFVTSFVGKLKIENNTPVTYYAVGCWELSDEGFKDPVYFENHITNLANQLAAEVTVTIQ